MSRSKGLSIIIPSYIRSAGLQLLLDSIWKQQPWAKRLEVIIVDNAPEPQPDYVQIQKAFSQKGMQIKLIHEPVAGVGKARNAGIKAASGEYMGFLDDDEEIPEGYLELLYGTLAKTENNTIFGGPYYPILPSPSPRWLKTDYLQSDHGDYPHNLANDKCLFGGNLYVPKVLFDQLGMFPTDLGHSGGKIDYGEDTDFLMRAARVGVIQSYDPMLFVWHHIPQRKQNLKWFVYQKQRALKQKAFLYVLYHQDVFHTKDNLVNRLFFLRDSMRACLDLMVCWLGIPFRDRKTYPFYQNYIIEKALPIYARMLFLWNIFCLIGKQPAPAGQE